MKIILTQDVIHVGEEGDVVNVKDGYARNYLLPTGAAVVFNAQNQSIFKQKASKIEKRKIEKRNASSSLKERLDNLSLSIAVPAGESGKLFGSVTTAMVQDLLLKEGFEIEKKKLDVPSHMIKMVGEYSVTVHLYENDKSVVKLTVLSEAEEKKRLKEEAEKRAKEEKASKEDVSTVNTEDVEISKGEEAEASQEKKDEE